MSGGQMKTLCVVYLLLAFHIPDAGAYRLRSSPKKEEKKEDKPAGEDLQQPLEPFGKGGKAFTFTVIDSNSFQREDTDSCICPIGKFWHWKTKQCVKQGGWGYECGFYPKEDMHRVCQDGFVCQRSSNLMSGYVGAEQSYPATCRHCKDEDNCKTGMERHEAECSKEVKLSGEACSTVSLKGSNAATAVKGERKPNGPGVVSATAKSEASSTKTKSATATVTHEEEASATKTAHASATAEEDVTVKKSAEASAKATASATAEATGEESGISVDVEEKATVTSEVKAKKSASASAHATGEAEADGTATATASGSAEGTATAEASGSASATSKRTVSVDIVTKRAETFSDGSVTVEVCISLSDAKALLGIPAGKRVGPRLAEQIIAVGNEKSYFVASEKARALAQKNGALSDEDQSKISKGEAREKAKLEADALSKEADAFKKEAGSNKEAQEAAAERAMEVAKDLAEKAAHNAAQAKADAAASKEAAANAEAKATEAAHHAAEKEATAEAKKNAGAAARSAAHAQAEANAAEAASEEAHAEAEKEAAAAAQAAAEAKAAEAAEVGAEQKAQEEAEAAAEAKAMESAEAKASEAAADVADAASPDMPGAEGDAANVIPRQDSNPHIKDRVNYSEQDMENLHP